MQRNDQIALFLLVLNFLQLPAIAIIYYIKEEIVIFPIWGFIYLSGLLIGAWFPKIKKNKDDK